MKPPRNAKKLAIDYQGTFLREPFKTCLVAAAFGVAFQAPAAAQQTGQDSAGSAVSSSQTPDGHIIFSRDVSYGSAIGPRTPGRANTVNAGPTDLILGSLATGLQPIGDDETANITAGTNSQITLIGDRIGLGMSALSSMSGSGAAPTNIGDIQNSATGGAIGQATGAIRDAMGSLRSVLGNGQ